MLRHLLQHHATDLCAFVCVDDDDDDDVDDACCTSVDVFLFMSRLFAVLRWVFCLKAVRRRETVVYMKLSIVGPLPMPVFAQTDLKRPNLRQHYECLHITQSLMCSPRAPEASLASRICSAGPCRASRAIPLASNAG